jgi:DNA polymerase-3 subunit alpha/error-prone DNA polymerase
MQARNLLAANGGIKNEGLKTGNNGLFENESIPRFPVPSPQPQVPSLKSPVPNPQSLWEEYRALGFLRNLHPLALWKNEVMALKYRVKALHIADYVGRNVMMLGWPVTQKEVWTKDGLAMTFLSLEDESGMYETVIFPKVYDKYNKLLFDQQPLLVWGKVTSDEGALSLEVTRIQAIAQVLREHDKSPHTKEALSLHNTVKHLECSCYEENLSYRNSGYRGTPHR